jgi:hypothetical protein
LNGSSRSTPSKEPETTCELRLKPKHCHVK